jgi:alpha/beta superfamily hydrolase
VNDAGAERTPPFRELRNGRGERLEFAFHAPRGTAGASARAAIVVIGHGVTSHLDRPWLVALGEALAAHGIAALRFSFAGNGRSEGRFEEATLTKEVEDLGAVIDAVEEAEGGRIAYAGHSMGAAIGVLRAAEDRRIAALVSLAGMVHVDAFFRRHFGALAPGEPMLGKAGCPWTEALAEDAARIGSLTALAARIDVPWRLVHGDADEMVPLADSLDAVAAAGGRPELVTLRGADHRFTGSIPALLAATVPWLAGVPKRASFHHDPPPA